MKLIEIAARIREHLKRFEADPTINRFPNDRPGKPYYMVGAGKAGRYVYLQYVSYQGQSCITKEQAEKYLQWLDAGNVGKHWRRLEGSKKA